ncbi:TonB-dependent receptor plug domain-containing protein [Thalassotalea mangrovi]|uniref:TonB-dependent receptor n=1 Tax=Thalassotalea mangrovi TaxID=2572245 RepID=A0A4U1BAG5_9GAMM|nr:TonB-dependent receptor [Thalassotalea mangrovi]TKB47526.1 TonB-dependent receptor [Thalassotalea mangrovi]
MFKKNSIVKALLVGTSSVSALSITAANADAQADAEMALNVERIEITGSRINRTDMETASPVTVIGAEQIAKSGFTSVQEILNVQPTAAGMSVGSTTNNGSGGSATVNLRGMGAKRTLVLLNGRRMVASGTGADSSVDLNTIPVAMIKSIEILKDGASAVYGSDAIAGVVNIITKKDFDGTELKAEASQTDKGDGTTSGFNALTGFEIAGGNLVLGAQYSNRGKIIQSDRDFVSPGYSSSIPEGTLGGLTPDGNGGFKPRDTGFDYTKDSYAQTPNELYSVFSSFNRELDADTEFNADVMFTHRDSKQQMAPMPATVDLETANLDSEWLTSFTDEQGNVPEELEYKRRMADAGPRIFKQQTDTIRASVGVKGYLDNDATWDMSATYGRNDAKDQMENAIHGGNMIESIYNNQDLWFSPNPISSSQLEQDGIAYVENNEGGNEQFTLAAGYSGVTESDIGYALGVESRFESGFYTPDMVVQNGESASAQQDPTSGNYSVNSAYAELSVPVGEAFTVEGAARYDDYSTFGGATTWKLGATYRFTDTFMVRSVLATGFRAPSVSELYAGNSGSFDYLSDPWGNEEDEQILVNYTGDENLQPEESESFTVGAVWEVADGLSTTLDYWKFEITDAISRVDVQNEMNQCFAGIQASCDSINITQDGDLSNMTSALTNIGQQNTSGIDWNVSYVLDRYRFTWDSTYLLEFEQDGVDYTGTIDGNIGGYSELKSTFMVNTDLTDNLSAQYYAQYIKGMDGNAWGTPFSTDDVVYHNVSATYFLGDDWTLNGGIKNLLDTEPENVPNGDDMDTVPSVYDVIGRTFFVSATVNF